MPIKGKYFPTQVPDEKVFLLIRRHWIFFAITLLFVIFLLTPIIVMIIYWTLNPDLFVGPLGNFLIVFSGIYLLSTWGLVLYGFVNYYLDLYIVTDKRIVDIKQKKFFSREIAELHLHQIQDVEAKVDGFLQTILHFGDIYIQTAGERENFVFQDVPHPYTLEKKIVDLHQAQIESGKRPGANFHGFTEGQANRSFEEKHDLGHKNVKNFYDDLAFGTHLKETDGGIKEMEESYNPEIDEEFEKNIDKNREENFLNESSNENVFGSSSGGESIDENREIKLE